MYAGVYQEPPLDPEILISSAMKLAEAQRKSRQLADDVLVKAMKVSNPTSPYQRVESMHVNGRCV